MFSALDGSSPDVVAREKEIAELASKEEALAAAKKGPKMGDWELRLWVSLAVVVVTVRRLAFALFPEVGFVRAVFGRILRCACHRVNDGLAPLCRYPNTHPNPLQNPLGVCVPVYKVWTRVSVLSFRYGCRCGPPLLLFQDF